MTDSEFTALARKAQDPRYGMTCRRQAVQDRMADAAEREDWVEFRRLSCLLKPLVA